MSGVNRQNVAADSPWSLRADLLCAKLLVWLASVGRDVQLTPDAHSYFFDRYARLARWHRLEGRSERARRLQALAEEHYRASGGSDEPPYAAAMARPRPRLFVRTDAVGRQDSGPDAAA